MMEAGSSKINPLAAFVTLGLVLFGGYRLFISPSRDVFVMKDNLVCRIEKSDDRSEIGKNIILTGLNTDSPRAQFPSGVNSPMKKVSETLELLVIQLVASGSGSIDTITLYKSTGKYQRESKGSFLGDYSHSDSGQCE